MVVDCCKEILGSILDFVSHIHGDEGPPVFDNGKSVLSQDGNGAQEVEGNPPPDSVIEVDAVAVFALFKPDLGGISDHHHSKTRS